MAQWIKLTADHDHRWESGAVTAFKEGIIVYVKDEVAEPAINAGRAEKTDKPDDDTPGYVPTASVVENTPDNPGNPSFYIPLSIDDTGYDGESIEGMEYDPPALDPVEPDGES